MRVIYILRGSPGCGKSTWIKDNNLSEYTICADDIRLLTQPPIMQVDGKFGISQKNDNSVWKTLFSVLEERMKRGELIFVDATHSKTKDFSKYKTLVEKYRYRAYCIDFSDVSIEVTKSRNKNRTPSYKVVPENVIDNMYSRFATQKPPNWCKTIKPSEFYETFKYEPRDLSKYEKVVLIGDIHGCWEPLNEYFTQNPFNENYFYIFLGDWVDRGLQEEQCVEFALSIYNKSNVCMVLGNHDQWTYLYANNQEKEIFSGEFKKNTTEKLKKFNKSDLREWTRRFAQLCYFKFHENYFLATHGGLPTLPENLLAIATEQLVKGVGSYEEVDQCAKIWHETMPKNHYSVVGHRNPNHLPLQVNSGFFNLDGQVEFGGNLRILEIYNESCCNNS